MRKDADKLLSRTIFTYLTILFSVFILKLFGLNYFNLDTENVVINKINDFVIYWRLENVWFCITLYTNTYIILAISCNDNTRKMKVFTLLTMPLNMLIQYIKTIYNVPWLFIFTDLLYLFILSICYTKFINKSKVHKHNISNYLLFTVLSILFQFISLITRNVEIINQTNLNKYLIVSIVLDIDYLVLILITYKLYFIKGGKSLWEWVHGSSLVLLDSLKTLPTKLQKSYQTSKPKTQEENLANKIYITLFWLYNIFTVVVILFVATLNDTFIECIFILSSFWINKGAFGRAFHLKKASTCFVVSTLSYYILNRITWKIGLSFLVPTILGITLSYITSKIMDRNLTTKLYRGIPEDDFYYIINKVTNNKEHIAICKRFYVDKQTDVKISIEFNYSTINIKKIKEKINKKIKELQ